MVQIGSPQCVKRRRHSCRTEALLKTEQEAAFIGPVANVGLSRGLLTA